MSHSNPLEPDLYLAATGFSSDAWEDDDVEHEVAGYLDDADDADDELEIEEERARE